jgi:hypothetical protein
MVNMRVPTSLIAALFVLSLISGCASYQKPVAMAQDKISPQKMAQARRTVDIMESSAKDVQTIALANSDACMYKGARLPFVFFANPQFKDPELRAAFLHAGWTEQPKLVAVSEAAKAVDGKFITKVGTEEIGFGEAGKAYWLALELAKTKKPVNLTFSDGSQATIETSESCLGITSVELGHEVPFNVGTGVELLPVSWALTATNHDEMLFLLGRSLYFSSSDGALSLNRALFGGAFTNGLITGLTFGLSKFFVDTKQTFVSMTRSSHLKEADTFGFKAARRAGADPVKVMAFVRRMSTDKLVTWEELRFGDGRLQALEILAALPLQTALAK